MHRENINPALWQQSIGLARQACARIFRDGGKPADALAAFGITSDASRPIDWSKAVEMVAVALTTAPVRRAA
jgi:hypothetical protein